MKNSVINTIVVGGLHTDIVALGANRLLSTGQYTYADKLFIGPGGKSPNIARMISTLLGNNQVAMIGKTSKDSYGLWKLPLDFLKKSGVNINFVKIEEFETYNELPGITLIPVDNEGNNQVYVLPGIVKHFSHDDINDATEVFETVRKNRGNLVLSLEFPLPTAIYSIKKANAMGLKVLLDPGGIYENLDYSNLLKQKIFLIKPNEHETKMLTGITVSDFSSAQKAAKILLQKNIQNVLITHGMHGGYLFNKNTQVHIPAPHIELASEKDETGCGDQTIATISALLTEGKDIVTAVKMGILAGTLQFTKLGIVPVTKSELHDASKFV